MSHRVTTTQFVHADQVVGEDSSETRLLRELVEDARAYLSSFRWCHRINAAYFGLGVGGVVAVVLFELSGEPSVDTQLWVVVGDLPSAYLVTDAAPTPVDALKVYCGMMEDWVRAVREDDQSADVFPVDASRTSESASLLERRIVLLRTEIIPAFE